MPRISRKGKAGQTPTITTTTERVWNCGIYARLSVMDGGRKGADTINTQVELVSSYVAQHSDLSLVDIFIEACEIIEPTQRT